VAETAFISPDGADELRRNLHTLSDRGTSATA
jgi:hypothetical protein